MQVVCTLLTTGEQKTFSSKKDLCKHLSISPDLLQVDYKHKPFQDGIFQKLCYSWYRIAVYETLENLLKDPIRLVFIDKYGDVHT